LSLSAAAAFAEEQTPVPYDGIISHPYICPRQNRQEERSTHGERGTM